MTATDHLKSPCATDWAAATNQAFMQDLARGTLSAPWMLGCLRRDCLFLEDFVRLLGATIALAPSLADAIPAAQFMGLVSGPENTHFRLAITALGADPGTPAAPHPVTAEFQRLMQGAIRSGCREQMLAVMVVAEWSCLAWASPHAAKATDVPFWFGEWISLHSGPDLEAFVACLRGQLDAAWPGLSTDEQRAVEARFIEATRLERAFFDAGYHGFDPA